jgi:hypothetical protein
MTDKNNFEIEYIPNNNDVYIMTGGNLESHDGFKKNIENLVSSDNENVNKPKTIYIVSLTDDLIKKELILKLNKKYKNEILENKLSIIQNGQQTDADINIIFGNNYTFKNNKIKISKVTANELYYIPNLYSNYDFAKRTFISGNNYIYDNIKPIEYFKRKKNKNIEKQNDNFINTYLDGKVTQLQNLYQNKNYKKLSRTYTELYSTIDNLLKDIPSRIIGGDDEYYPFDDFLYY